MTTPSPIDDLIRRFVDDRDSLSDDELAALASAASESREVRERLRDQLVVDEHLGQLLTVDRTNFRAQVEQRIADYLRGEDELNRQASELRELALDRLTTTGENASRAWLSPLAIAATLLLAVGLGIYYWQQSEAKALLAQIEATSGNVILKRAKISDQYAQAGMPLERGDRLIVDDESSLTLRWSDETLVRLEAGTQIDIPAKLASAKQIYIDRGHLSATVAKQPSGRPMVFQTPHAEAIVRGTELYLHVGQDETQLEVAEGQVELVEHHTHDSELVATSETATAAPGEPVKKNTIQWPTSRDGLVYLFAGTQRPSLVRSSGVLIPAKIEPRDGAEFNAEGEIDTSHGYFVDENSARDVASELRSASEFTIEFILASQPCDDARTVLALEGESPILRLVQNAGLGLNFQSADGSLHWFATLPEAGKRTHVLVKVSAGQMSVWIDGNDVATYREPPRLLAETLATRITLGSTTEPRWPGRIAALAIYNRALSREEIAQAFRP